MSVCPCTMLQITTNVNGANSTKPLLGEGTVYKTKFKTLWCKGEPHI